jgi:hypothetical protein
VFRRAVENQYSLKVKASRALISEVNKKFPTLPFTLRALEDERAVSAHCTALHCTARRVIRDPCCLTIAAARAWCTRPCSRMASPPPTVAHTHLLTTATATHGHARSCMLTFTEHTSASVHLPNRRMHPCLPRSPPFFLVLCVQARMGLPEVNRHQLLHVYPVLAEREGVTVAHFKATVLLLASGPSKVTGLPLPPAITSEKTALRT